ncbi:phosphate ABC transporter permease PstA [Caldovatus aquaticus]|uniref:Phosphate transport system permease protein PstA n=1 Tax=Caldovatus aquaticus TaxID=2865671 RepID=A0ABS7EZU7_9PROT|nr:phosphate ABC transporter permease PstA [Caldovatus aquaticus]
MSGAVLEPPAAARGLPQPPIGGLRAHADLIFAALGLLAMLVAVLTLAALVLDLAVRGLPRLDLQFLTSFPSRRPSQAGILSAWVGTTLVMLVTAAITIPLGIGAAIYLEEYAPRNRLTDLIEINVANLAGVPSIIYGLLALGLFVYALGLGRSILTAGLTLALLVLPIIIVATREALRAVPPTVREAAYALGATRWRMIADHLLPYSAGGIATGVIIALSRAIGETAPLITIGALTFIAFLPTPPIRPDFPFVSFQWLSDPFTVLPIQMFNWVSRPGTDFLPNAAAAGLVLIVMTIAMNLAAIVIRIRVRRRVKW